jgi:hypothetical protein
MRSLKALALIAALVAICVVTMGLLLSTSHNKFGIADTRQVSFEEAIYVGNVLLPKGPYEVKHTMEGDNHVMVFTQLNVRHPAVAKAKCTLVALPKKAEHNGSIFTYDSSNQRVLQELVFKGDTAKHVF